MRDTFQQGITLFSRMIDSIHSMHQCLLVLGFHNTASCSFLGSAHAQIGPGSLALGTQESIVTYNHVCYKTETKRRRVIFLRQNPPDMALGCLFMQLMRPWDVYVLFSLITPALQISFFLFLFFFMQHDMVEFI